jgi:pectinesterase
MPTLEEFAHSETIFADDFAKALAICGDLRKKDPTKPYHLVLRRSLSKGPFVFPYDHFYLEGETETTLAGSLYAQMEDEQGHELTTWKTATLKVTGSHNLFRNLTIRNDAGDPEKKGQEVALAVYGDDNLFANCTLHSTQDTLFVGPLPDDLSTRYIGFLPENERYHEGNTQNDFIACHISGSVDFIFGAGKASFYRSVIGSLDDGRDCAYVSAPAHSLKDDFGFYFDHCCFVNEGVKPQTIYLARPWRDYGKAVFAYCSYENHIKAEGFAEWNAEKRYRTARFEEYPLQPGRVSWAKNKENAPLPERYQIETKRLDALFQRLK